MLKELFEFAETLLAWFERIEQTALGRNVTAFVITIALAIGQWVVGLPIVLIIPIALATFLVLILLLLYVPVWLRTLSRFPLAVSAPTIGEGRERLQAHVLILNGQSDRRAEITMELCFKASPSSGGHWSLQADTGELRTGLGPDEKTEGVVSFQIDADPESNRRGLWFLRVHDEVSGRTTPLFEIPGSYPTKSWLTSNKRPVFVMAPDEKMTWTNDWTAHLSDDERRH